jgi:Novel toxin 15
MNKILDEIWNRVVGGLDWLKQVIFGEFVDNRDMSAVIADMLVSFVPGVVIVTSARDLVAVIMRMVKHPEKRDQIEEWMLIVACAVPLVLPVLAAAAGAAAAGVGAIIGGIGGSEAGAALRAVCLLLIKKGAYALVEVVGFLRKFIKGDILVVLRDMKFVKYAEALAKYVSDFIGSIIGVIRKLRVELMKVNAFDWLAGMLHKLEELERGFYGVQTSAMNAIPRALAELDARLQHVLAEALPHNPRLAHAGVPAGPPHPVTPTPQRVPAMPSNPLGHPSGTHPPAHPSTPHPTEPNVHPENPREPHLKKMKEEKVPCFKSEGLPAGKAAEMERQLAGQEAGLNKMTVQEYLDGRDKFKVDGRGSGTPAANARAQYEKDLTTELQERYRREGMSAAQAKQSAIADAAVQMKTLAALHNPDMVAAGTNVIGGMGDRQVNSSIGSQWKGRVGDLDTAAKSVPAGERATTRMNAKLERCK